MQELKSYKGVHDGFFMWSLVGSKSKTCSSLALRQIINKTLIYHMPFIILLISAYVEKNTLGPLSHQGPIETATSLPLITNTSLATSRDKSSFHVQMQPLPLPTLLFLYMTLVLYTGIIFDCVKGIWIMYKRISRHRDNTFIEVEQYMEIIKNFT